MPAKVGYLVIDAAEPERLASFWCAATAEVEELGGRWLEPGNTRELEGFRWRCMADPEGNEFDLDVLPPMRS
jgi:hypothetical protein